MNFVEGQTRECVGTVIIVAEAEILLHVSFLKGTDLFPTTQKLKIMNYKVSLLEWRKPRQHPQDYPSANLVADGLGGRYAIQLERGGYLLWLAEDEYTWKKFQTIEEAKDWAEKQFVQQIITLYKKLEQ